MPEAARVPARPRSSSAAAHRSYTSARSTFRAEVDLFGNAVHAVHPTSLEGARRAGINLSSTRVHGAHGGCSGIA